MKTWSKEKESLQDVIKNLRDQLAQKQKSEAEYVQITVKPILSNHSKEDKNSFSRLVIA